ncbi:MAG: hypothetical protein HQ589_05170 [Syntrophaceae bacterium]|nr:hypothetical protein [Syntrophaceae bacterium]
MNLVRIYAEFNRAKQQFSHVEMYKTSDGNVFVKAALQPSSQVYIVSIYFSEAYPNRMPHVYITKPTIEIARHRYKEGHICYLHPSMWNPGIHDLSFVIARAAKWLSKHEIWKRRGVWPGAEIKH